MNNRGFTLIESLICLVVLGVLLAFAIPATSDWRQGAQCKEAARGILSVLRQGRSTAVRQNQNTTVTIDLTNRKYSFAGTDTSLPNGITIEARASVSDAWQQNGSFSITFRPQGNSDSTIFVRINQDDDLLAQVDSTATGLAHM